MPVNIPDESEEFAAVSAPSAGAGGKKKEDIIIPVVLFVLIAALGGGIFFLHASLGRRAESLQRTPPPARGTPPAPQVVPRSQPAPLAGLGAGRGNGARPAPDPGPAARAPDHAPATDNGHPADVPENMILIPAGRLITGFDREGNPREVEMPAFLIDRHPVTNRQYQAFLEATGRSAPRDNRGPRHNIWQDGTFPPALADHPVVNVSYEDAAAYAAWAGRRLPTENEWEKAARADTKNRYPWGSNDEPAFANVADNPATDGTTPVGAFPRDTSPYGVTDLAGNVREWTSSFFDHSDPYSRVIKGGSFLDRARESTTWRRIQSSLPRHDLGFRCARNAR